MSDTKISVLQATDDTVMAAAGLCANGQLAEKVTRTLTEAEAALQTAMKEASTAHQGSAKALNEALTAWAKDSTNADLRAAVDKALDGFQGTQPTLKDATEKWMTAFKTVQADAAAALDAQCKKQVTALPNDDIVPAVESLKLEYAGPKMVRMGPLVVPGGSQYKATLKCVGVKEADERMLSTQGSLLDDLGTLPAQVNEFCAQKAKAGQAK